MWCRISGTYPYPYGPTARMRFCERILRYFVFLFEATRLKVWWLRGLKASDLKVSLLLNFEVTVIEDWIK